jgi:hypothetical protein
MTWSPIHAQSVRNSCIHLQHYSLLISFTNAMFGVELPVNVYCNVVEAFLKQ